RGTFDRAGVGLQAPGRDAQGWTGRRHAAGDNRHLPDQGRQCLRTVRDRLWRRDPPSAGRAAGARQDARHETGPSYTNIAQGEVMSAVPSVSPEELQQLRQQGSDVELIDVRTPIEYAEVHVDGARLVPLDMLDPQAIAATCQGKPVYVLCRTGGRAAKAC